MKKLLTILLLTISLAAIGQNTRFNFRSDVKIGDSAVAMSPWAGKYASPFWVYTYFLMKSDTALTVATKYDLDTLAANIVYDESDPIFALDSAAILHWYDSIVKIATKYDIDTLTFLRSFTESDPVFALDSAAILHWYDSIAKIATKYDIDTLSFLRSITEVDPVFALDSAAILHWYDSIAKIATKYDLDTLTFIRTETDPVFANDSANLVHWADTLVKIATKYDLDTLTVGGSTSVDSLAWVKGTANVYLRDATDKVGIGTALPDSTLTVVGSIRASTNIKGDKITATTGMVAPYFQGAATQVSTANISSSASYYPLYVSSNTPGSQQVSTNATLKFNPATGLFTVPTLSLPALTDDGSPDSIITYNSAGVRRSLYAISTMPALQDSITRDYAITKEFDAAGDLIVGTGNNAFDRLAKGSNQQVLKIWSGVVGWHADSVGAGGSGVPADSLAFKKGTSTVYLRDVNDNVSLGGTVAINKLDVRGGANIYTNQDSIKFWVDKTATDVDGDSGITVLPNGCVGIGTSAPVYPLDIAAAGSYMARMGGSGERLLQLYNSEATNYRYEHVIAGTGTFGAGTAFRGKYIFYDRRRGATVYTFDTTGRMGINTSTPDEMLVVVSASSTTGKYTSSGWTHSSDSTMKDSIRDIKNVLRKLKRLQGVKFVWKEDTAQWLTRIDTTGFKVTVKKDTIWKDSIYQVVSGTNSVTTVTVKVIDKITEKNDTTYTTKTTKVKDPSFVKHKQLGFIAQSVKNVIPEAVVEGEDGKLSIADNQILPIVVEAAKEIAADVDTLNDITLSTQIITPDSTGIKRSMLAKTMYLSLNEALTIPVGTKQIANGKVDGQEITLVGMANVKAMTLRDADNINLSTATVTLKKFQTITLIWAAPLNTWVEKSRSLN